FFQAEDGIRDLTVTGVQTCALPISGEFLSQVGLWQLFGTNAWMTFPKLTADGNISYRLWLRNIRRSIIATSMWMLSGHSLHLVRSEERRVGKGCRCWWVPQP